CPQGSCLSPHLWCLVMDSLLRRLNLEGFYAQAYADDGLVMITGKFVRTVCERMQVACRIVQGWCEENGLSVNPGKTELILFTRKRNLTGFIHPILYQTRLSLSQQVKYLGVILDSKLTWKAYVEQVVNKTTAIMWQLRRTVGRKLG
ncbi:MAG: hypothetical protein KTM48_02865, partial [Wolbachia endosymbiont of Pissodes strobi]|nr:hypothetical protein [Wolbachia endosymbiont of Pissodes strobi]